MAVRSRSLMLGAGRVEHCSKHKLTAAAGAAGAAAAGAGGGGVRFQGGLKLQLAGCEMGESECTEISAALASLSPSGEDSAERHGRRQRAPARGSALLAPWQHLAS
jgi:hypothetical protein